MTEPVADPGPTSFLDSLGPRARRRAEPRTSIAIAGAGCVLGVVGVLTIAGDTGFDDSSGELNKAPGIVLCALVIAAGYFVLASIRQGPLATGGSVAAALGVPPLMFFLTFDENSFPPYSTEGILIVSTIAWLGSYVVGPGRGRPFFLGAGLIGLWFTILQLTEKVFTSPFDLIGWFFFRGGGSESFESTGSAIDPTTGEIIIGEDFGDDVGGFEGGGFDAPDVPDLMVIGLLSLGLGIAFLLASRWLDKRDRHGTATPFALAALPCLFVGVLAMADDLEAAGSGLLMVVIGLGLAYHGATVWRRATTWVGGGVMALGLAIFLGDMAGDSVTTGGMLFIAGGIGLVFAGHLIASALDEPDEMLVTVGGPPVPPGPMRRVAPLVATPEPPPADDAQWAPPPPPPGPDADDPPIPPPPSA